MEHGEAELTTVVDGGEFDADILTDGEHIGDFAEALVGDLRDVEHAVYAWKDIDKSTKIFYRYNFAVVDFADFWLLNEGSNPIDGCLHGFGVAGGDGDEAGLGDVYGSTGFGGDFINSFATFADNGANLVLLDHDFLNARSVFGHLVTRGWNDGKHMV